MRASSIQLTHSGAGHVIPKRKLIILRTPDDEEGRSVCRPQDDPRTGLRRFDLCPASRSRRFLLRRNEVVDAWVWMPDALTAPGTQTP